jgi:DNA polymerase-1
VLVDTADQFDAFLSELQRRPRFAFDTETTHMNPAWARLVGMSFSWQVGSGWYLPLAGKGRTLSWDATLAALQPILADPRVEKVGQNLKYDLVVLANHGVCVKGVAFDTMVASFLLDSTRRSHSLEALARDLLGRETIPISRLIGKGKQQITFDQVDTQQAAIYAGEDAEVTWALYERLSAQLTDTDLQTLFRETEMPMVQVLASMQAEGVHLDTQVLAQMSSELKTRLEDLTDQIYAEAGRPFNIDSPKQLAAVLFDELNLPSVKRTRTGYSTDAETLETLAAQTRHPVPRLVREYRELIKLKGTYIDPLPELVCPRTGRVHASFHQTTAVTGRLSSSEPNLQNIPVRTELGRRIRQAFVPRDTDHVLLTADYSQIELRVLAHFCQDHALKQAFTEDRDIHRFVAAQVFNVALDEVTSEQRSKAKAVNFGIVYGQTAYGLSRGTGMAVSEAQRFIDRYFERYPGIRVFIDTTIEQARAQGFVRTILGRRRSVPGIDSRNHGLRSAAERLAVNTVIQGSAADLIKRAMISIHHRILDENRPSRMVIQVHDELVFDVPRDRLHTEIDFVEREMTHALLLDVPIKVDTAWAGNWMEAK